MLIIDWVRRVQNLAEKLEVNFSESTLWCRKTSLPAIKNADLND